MCPCLETLQRLTSSRGGRLWAALCIMWIRYVHLVTSSLVLCTEVWDIFQTMHEGTAMQLYSGSKIPIFLLARLPPLVGNSFLCARTKNAILLSVQPAVSAALLGRVLVVEGVEKAERNVLPVLNNLLENREMQLKDGRFILSADRYDKLLKVCRVVIFIILQQIPGGHSCNHLV